MYENLVGRCEANFRMFSTDPNNQYFVSADHSVRAGGSSSCQKLIDAILATTLSPSRLSSVRAPARVSTPTSAAAVSVLVLNLDATGGAGVLVPLSTTRSLICHRSPPLAQTSPPSRSSRRVSCTSARHVTSAFPLARGGSLTWPTRPWPNRVQLSDRCPTLARDVPDVPYRWRRLQGPKCDQQCHRRHRRERSGPAGVGLHPSDRGLIPVVSSPELGR
jgi:hypothetical protein